MPIKVIKRSGATTVIDTPVPATPANVPVRISAPRIKTPPEPNKPVVIGSKAAFADSPLPSKQAVDAFCEELSRKKPEDMNMKTEVYVALYLGYGSREARAKLGDNIITSEWPSLIPWFGRPDVGDTILPENAQWEIHRTQEEGHMGGWATLTIGTKTWSGSALTPWAAFAICMLQARADNAFTPREPR